MSVVTRFAPSPTGLLHIGGVRTALYSWLQARKEQGKFVLRIEDTDRERSTQESVNAILDGMHWIGLDYDEGPIYQTDRFDRYRELVQKLLDDGKAYRCYCTKEELDTMREAQMKAKQKPRYDGRCRDLETAPEGKASVIRFRNPTEGAVEFDDLVRGKITINNAELDDLIIARSDGTPTYNFTVVVDDMDMGITTVIRGDDHINNTPRQINIFEALGATPPQFAHVPMILGPDGARLSKRHGAVGVMQYREEGYLPAALLNYLVRLGWSHGDQEIFSIDEMIEKFDIRDVNRAASTFNTEKLVWINHQYIMNLPVEALRDEFFWHLRKLGADPDNGPAVEQVIDAQRERTKTMAEMAERSLFLYADFDEYDEKAAKKNLRPVVLEPLEDLLARLQKIEHWSGEAAHQQILECAEAFELKMGKLAQPLRVAVVGSGISPPIDNTLELLGREKTVVRMHRALEYIRARAN